MRAVSAADSAIGGDAGRAGLAAAGGQRRAAGVNLQVSGIYSGQVGSAGGVLARGRGGGEDAGQPARAAWMAAVLSWASAVSAVCRQIASYVLAWDWSQPMASFPVLKVVSQVSRGWYHTAQQNLKSQVKKVLPPYGDNT